MGIAVAGPGETVKIHIAGLAVGLHGVDDVLADLEVAYREFAARGDTYARSPSNPHLCFSGCGHCCRNSAFFAMTLAEALRLTLAVGDLDEPVLARVLAEADRLHALQQDLFRRLDEPEDVPGRRDEELLGCRVARVAAAGVACPLLDGDQCAAYGARPLLCRAYGYPVDAFAVEHESTFVFRSLCRLYTGLSLHDYVRAHDLRDGLAVLSRRVAGGADLGRFTTAEAILAEIEYDGIGAEEEA